MDPKLANTFIKILNPPDMEAAILKHSDLFSPLQLIDMLAQVLTSSEQLRLIALKIKKRIEADIQTIGRGELSADETARFDALGLRMKQVLSISCPLSKRSILIRLFLDIVLAAKKVFDLTELVLPEIGRRIKTDLSSAHFDLGVMSCALSSSLPIIATLSKSLHDDLLGMFKRHVFTCSPEVACDIFLSEAKNLSPEISEALFNRAVLVFSSKNDNVFKALWKKVVGAEGERVKNLSRLFSQCIRSLEFGGGRGSPETIAAVTELPAAASVMKMYSKLHSLDLLDQDVEKKARLILNQTREFLARVKSGNLSLDQLSMLSSQDRLDRLVSLCECLEEVRQPEDVRLMVDLRMKERDAFFEAKLEFETFKSRFDGLSPKLSAELEKVGSQFTVNTRVIQLESVCQMRQRRAEAIHLKLKHISSNDREVMRRHTDLFSKSFIFRKFHESVTRDENFDANFDLLLWKKAIVVCTEAFSQFEDFVVELFRLETIIAVVEDKLKKIYHQGRLRDELRHLQNSILKSRLPGSYDAGHLEDIIDKLFTMHRYAEAAKAVQQAAGILGQQKPFPIVARILKATYEDANFENQPLSFISDDLIEAGTSFSAWTDKEIQALLALTKTSDLLKFLKASMITSRLALKTYSELASISAGSTDFQIDRVSHFSQSVTAYAPLILDTKIDRCSFPDFMKACASVFASVARDPTIPKKLIDSSEKNLKWLKAFKEQHGSVEVSSLSQVNWINKSGVFNVQTPSGKSQLASIESCITLKYEQVNLDDGGRHSDEPMKELTLEEAQDLRSKLMLISAGVKGKEGVDRFVRTLGLVEVVAENFVALLNAGCHLFSQWRLQVCCPCSFPNLNLLN